jgi:hypothetical protein
MFDAYCVDLEGDIVLQQPLGTATGTSSPGGVTQQQQQTGNGASVDPTSVYLTPYTRSPLGLTPRLMDPSVPGGMGFPPGQEQPTGWRSYGHSVGDLMNP